MKNKLYLFASLLVLSIGLVACKQSTTETNQQQKEHVDIEETNRTTYDRNKGAHKVAPEMTKLLKDTLGIVMYELTIEPGDTLPWHEHPYHTAYILEGGTLKIIFEDSTEEWDFPKGKAVLSAPFGDIAINTGETTIKVLMHEFYSLDIKN